jgi:hypothetical protein
VQDSHVSFEMDMKYALRIRGGLTSEETDAACSQAMNQIPMVLESELGVTDLEVE